MQTNICESCRHYGSKVVHENEARRLIRFCTNDLCTTDQVREQFPDRLGMPIDMAREICDREGDGFFVYYEPKDPSAGVAFVQITREPRAHAAAGGAR